MERTIPSSINLLTLEPFLVMYMKWGSNATDFHPSFVFRSSVAPSPDFDATYFNVSVH